MGHHVWNMYDSAFGAVSDSRNLAGPCNCNSSASGTHGAPWSCTRCLYCINCVGEPHAFMPRIIWTRNHHIRTSGERHHLLFVQCWVFLCCSCVHAARTGGRNSHVAALFVPQRGEAATSF